MTRSCLSAIGAGKKPSNEDRSDPHHVILCCISCCHWRMDLVLDWAFPISSVPLLHTPSAGQDPDQGRDPFVPKWRLPEPQIDKVSHNRERNSGRWNGWHHPGGGACYIQGSFRNWNVGCPRRVEESEGNRQPRGSRWDNPAPIKGMNFILISALSALTPFGCAQDTLCFMHIRFNSQSQQESV